MVPEVLPLCGEERWARRRGPLPGGGGGGGEESTSPDPFFSPFPF